MNIAISKMVTQNAINSREKTEWPVAVELAGDAHQDGERTHVLDCFGSQVGNFYAAGGRLLRT
jgi:hypothetical protein